MVDGGSGDGRDSDRGRYLTIALMGITVIRCILQCGIGAVFIERQSK
jgi:hypothetical protein